MKRTVLEMQIGLGCTAVGLSLAAGAIAAAPGAFEGAARPEAHLWLVTLLFLLCGAAFVGRAHRQPFKPKSAPEVDDDADWQAFLWVGAAFLVSAGVINTLGFIVGSTLCFTVVAQGYQWQHLQADRSLSSCLKSATVGCTMTAPVYWFFTHIAGLPLPGLTGTGWL